MNKSRLLIVMNDRAWTLAALHLACAIARRGAVSIILLKMVPVHHPLLLGTTAGSLSFTAEDADALADMTATAEDYGAPLEVELFQYANYWPGVVDAAAQLNVTAVIVRLSPSSIPYGQAIRRWWLSRRLAKQQQLFLTLDDLKPSLVWTPSITLQSDITHLLERHQS